MNILHNPGCLRHMIATILLATGQLGQVPSYRNRWDCGGCIPRKLLKSLSRAIQLTNQVVLVPELCVPGRTRDLARKLEVGYCGITLKELAYRMILADPKLFPDAPIITMQAALQQIIHHGLEHFITRLSCNGLWLPLEHLTTHHSFCTFTEDSSVVAQAFRDAGFGSGYIGDMDPEQAEHLIRLQLENARGASFLI